MAPVSYEPVIGLEVHCQLKTASKAFSPDSAQFGGAPNRRVDAVSLGHPGTLPVLNAKVIEYAVRMGLATHCQVAERSVLARKHYFYPDLPKGYQISQYESPLCEQGFVDIFTDIPRRIGITRIHIEEDAGKSLHHQDKANTLLDFNRCGVPLIEIVSEPDLRSGREAYLYVQKIRQLVRYLDICDGNMEEGSLRCDANVSVRRAGTTTLGVKTEIKNMNSFRHVERAIDHEIARQIAQARQGKRISHETLLWDAERGQTRAMRSKEQAHDYRYFPDPDLPPIVVTSTMRADIQEALPELPDERRERFNRQFSLPPYDAGVLTEERGVADYFEAVLAALRQRDLAGAIAVQAKAVSNIVMTGVLRVLKEQGLDVAKFPISAPRLSGLIHLRLRNALSSSGVREVYSRMLEDDREAECIAEAHNLLQVSDEGRLLPVVQEVLAAFPAQVEVFRCGKSSVIGFFIGQVMKQFGGSADPKRVRALLLEHLRT